MNIDIVPSSGYPSLYEPVTKHITKQNPSILLFLTVLIVVVYMLSSSLGSGAVSSAADSVGGIGSAMTSTGNGMGYMELFFWGFLVFLLLTGGLQYFFSLDIQTAIRNIFSPIPEVDIDVISKHETAPVPEITFEKQVFHIPDNKYTYEDARAVCKAYGARLANYEEIEDAYEKGGEWCGYGWSKDQMALFPTQKKTWDKLQKRGGHRNDCGRPGVNGGYIANKNVRYGANCFGYKPEMNQRERQAMETTDPMPSTPEERAFERKVKEYRKKLPDIMVSPFNHNDWSVI